MGWVISGVFSENIPHGLFSQLSSLGSSTPNTEIKVSIVDLGSDSGKRRLYAPAAPAWWPWA
jgi:hypothetical protein